MTGIATANYDKLFLVYPKASEAYVDWETQKVNANLEATTSNIMLGSYGSPLPYIEYIYLGGLIHNKYNLKKYIMVIVTNDGHEVIGEIPELGIYAFGESTFEIIREIEKDIIELYEELFAIDENKLGTIPKKWKSFLAEHIKKG